jgi:hypothetical protein
MSNPIDDGGPAYPNNDAHGCAYTGMTLRDWFAGQALAASCPIGYPVKGIAKRAYEAADAMIAAREEVQS